MHKQYYQQTILSIINLTHCSIIAYAILVHEGIAVKFSWLLKKDQILIDICIFNEV